MADLVWCRTTDPILASIFNGDVTVNVDGDVTIKNGGENWVCATPDYRRPFGVTNDGLANPALRRRKLKNRSAEKLKVVI